MPPFDRRTLLAGSALCAGAALLPWPSQARVAAAPTQGPGVYRYNLGSYQLTALYDGVWYVPLDEKFIRNASSAEVDAALAAAFLPPRILHLREPRNPSYPSEPIGQGNARFLKGQRHELLGENVIRQRRRDNWFDITQGPKINQSRRLDQ